MSMGKLLHTLHLDEHPSGNTLLLAALTSVVAFSYGLLALIIFFGPAAYDSAVGTVAGFFRWF